MLKRIPRQVLFINIYGYIVVAVMVILATLLFLHSDNLSLFDFGIVVGLLVLFGAVWWRFHPRLNVGVPNDGQALKRSRKYTLLAFESEFCPLCMSIGRRIRQLAKVEGLQIYRLSIHTEPGKTLFKEYDGRVTPTYVLLDPQGNLMQDWPLTLPIEHILHAIRRQSQQPV